MFEIGQQVVCIRRGKWMAVERHDLVVNREPAYGEVFTINGINTESPCGNLFLAFEETWYDGNTNVEPAFLAYFFRPVRRTDISIFTAMLNPAPVKENA